MCAHVISGPVIFEGKTLVTGDVKLFVERCEVEGVDFSFSPQYGLLLLKDETKVQARNLLKELTRLSFSDNTKIGLTLQVCEKGFEAVWLELERYRQFAPVSGEPRFYSEVGYNGQVNGHIISLVSAEKALRFYVTDDLRTLLVSLPRFVYKVDSVYEGFCLTLERYRYLLGREKDFFVFVEELGRYVGYMRGEACKECFMRYFEDPAGAHNLLRAIRGKASSRECRDQLFGTLERTGVLEFSEGLFVRSSWSTFYVSKDGDVQRLCYSKKVELREAVLRAHQKGKLPTKLEEENDKLTLKRIAETVGKIKPELALLILP